MNILEIKSLEIPDVKVVKYSRYKDDRGYFSEHFRKDDILNNPELSSMKGLDFVQGNESYSWPGAVRGFHFQWNPEVGKFFRNIYGDIIDCALDLRKGSPTYGKAAAYRLSNNHNMDTNEWIWIPPGFGHSFFTLENSLVEYLCTGIFNPDCQGVVSPLSQDIDWSLCDARLRERMSCIKNVKNILITDKDRNAPNIEQWTKDKKSDNIVYKI